MRPIEEMGAQQLARVEIVLSDIDDTITSEGRLTAAAFAALERLQAAGVMLGREFGLDAARDGGRMVYLGDSPNDEPMFAAFPLSIGVDNIRNFVHRLGALPKFVTRGRSGAGFAEFAERLIAARGSPS